MCLHMDFVKEEYCVLCTPPEPEKPKSFEDDAVWIGGREEYYAGGSDRNTRAFWEKHEDLAVLAKDVPDTELSRKLGRTLHAIQNRRMRLKKGLKPEY